MYNKVPERIAHRVRWILTLLWLLLISSLLYDPISIGQTLPEQSLSPLGIDPSHCILVQGDCLVAAPYSIGIQVFWAIVIPASIFILLVFGHEFWRRICPLSFLSQMPRALSSQRRVKRISNRGKVYYEIAKIGRNSWLSKNHLYVQFSLLFIGLNCRILFLNSNHIALAIWLLTTVVAAVGIGWYYGGKSWCNYFCPMSPVQRIYGEPRGLFTSQAHTSLAKITQSMCRETTSGREEISACVGCQVHCVDIDSERSYWENIAKPDRKVLYYGYLGMMLGYFSYYYLYSGNWDYLMYGLWYPEPSSVSHLLDPGFYIFQSPIPIPKIVAAPLTLAIGTTVSVIIGIASEQIYRLIREGIHPVDSETRQHEIYSIVTFICFNIFFAFVCRPFYDSFNITVAFIFEGALLLVSCVWFQKTWVRSRSKYFSEKLTSRLIQKCIEHKPYIKSISDDRLLNDISIKEASKSVKMSPYINRSK